MQSTVKRRQSLVLMILAVGLTVSHPALAQEAGTSKGKGVKVNSNRRLSIDFDDELVSGSKQNPDVEFLFNRKSSNFKRMIKLRNDFIPEVKRGRSDFGTDKKK